MPNELNQTPSSRRIWRWLVGGTVGVLLVVVLGVWLLHSVKAVPRLQDERSVTNAGEQAEDTGPVTLDGEWLGEHSDKPYVRSLRIEKKEFPCNGEVRFFHKGGVEFLEPDRTISFGGNQIRVQGTDKIEVVCPVVWREIGDELVGTHARGEHVVAKVKLSGRFLAGEALVEPSLRLLLGNVDEVVITQLIKRRRGSKPANG